MNWATAQTELLMLRQLLTFSALAGACWASQAADLRLNTPLTQSEFNALVEDVGALVSYRAQIPTEALGTTGFDIGVSMTTSSLQQMDSYTGAVTGSSNSFYTGAVHVHKGLPLGFDIGGFFSQGLDTNVRHRGFELRYALIDGSTTTPAVGLRASTTQLTNVDNLDIDTKGLDISVSKGFVMFTPYAGAGVVRVSGETSGLRSSTTLNKFFVGVGMNLLALNVNIEYDKTGDVPSYSAKLGLRF
jgi:hypothetical protein